MRKAQIHVAGQEPITAILMPAETEAQSCLLLCSTGGVGISADLVRSGPIVVLKQCQQGALHHKKKTANKAILYL